MSALGLGGYSSSEDEAEDVTSSTVNTTQNGASAPTVQQTSTTQLANISEQNTNKRSAPQSEDATSDPTPPQPSLGPAPGPSAMPSTPTSTLPEPEDPGSPYTTTRAQIRSLTMPPYPSFAIPASPPGSPAPSSTAKFTKFLSLKTQGVHFNERLLQSSALRNPGLLDKLMEFAGIVGDEQYASSLVGETTVRTKFPEWAFADQLVKSHEGRRKREEGRKKERVEFVRGPDEGMAPAKKKSRFDR